MLLKLLKRETHDLHVEAERHVRILDPDATEAQYVRYLQRMYGFHAAIEAAFADHAELAAAGFDAAGRSKRGLIEADLAILGAPTGPLASIPDVRGLARGAGAAYVVEGSTLGGAFILAKMPAQRTARFLAGYGDDTGPRWKQFAAVVAQVTDEAAAIAAARDTFATLIAWLEEPARPQPRPFFREARA